ncbi:MAG: hypothetical protein MI919_03260 [Holophagales bacterium]|nr:hypothetical protein [Holophagales bacterium]
MSTSRLLACLLLTLWITSPAFGSLGVCAADIDGDGISGSSDLSIILGAWGTADPRADLNGNGYVGDADLNTLFDQWGACNTCPADLDGDGTVDANDRKHLEQAYGRDCSANLGRLGDVGNYDLEILLTSWSASADPDADPRADLNGDGTVDVSDLNQLLAQFGTDCAPDLNSDGVVDTNDLWFLLGSWGACP